MQELSTRRIAYGTVVIGVDIMSDYSLVGTRVLLSVRGESDDIEERCSDAAQLLPLAT